MTAEQQTTLPLSNPPKSTQPWLIGTWNVNSVRARMGHVLRFLVEYRPQVLCLQETKVQDADFPQEPFAKLGYYCAIFGEKKQRGVAILSTQPLELVEKGFTNQHIALPNSSTPEEARMIHGVSNGVRIFNVYFPNGTQVGSERFAYKLSFYQQLQTLLQQRFSSEEAILLVGDFNVAPEAIDVHDVAAWEGKICFHPKEREVLSQLKQWGFCDLFRRINPSLQRYTWWDFRTDAYARDAGLRIDFIWASRGMKARCTQCWIETHERERDKPSDHVPVMAYFG